ncbi:MAG: type IV pilin [Candidatus Heimdallarchaeota archaeon]|nr:type IV pilin [Candidatus Heimdallarchaeota archaeon]
MKHFKILKGNSKKAVSPVIATVLLIALVVAAAAMVYFLVIPMLAPDHDVLGSELKLQDQNKNFLYDQASFLLVNSGTMEIFP